MVKEEFAKGVSDESAADALLLGRHSRCRVRSGEAAGTARAVGLRTARRGLGRRLKLRILVVGAGVSGISAARGLLRDGHDVAVFDQRPNVTVGGGAVTIWSNGATVLQQLGVDMAGAGQSLSTVRVMTSTGRPVATIDLNAMV